MSARVPLTLTLVCLCEGRTETPAGGKEEEQEKDGGLLKKHNLSQNVFNFNDKTCHTSRGTLAHPRLAPQTPSPVLTLCSTPPCVVVTISRTHP